MNPSFENSFKYPQEYIVNRLEDKNEYRLSKKNGLI